MNYCKGIYAGCGIIASAPCEPCKRIAKGKSTVAEEMARKERQRPKDERRKPRK